MPSTRPGTKHRAATVPLAKLGGQLTRDAVRSAQANLRLYFDGAVPLRFDKPGTEAAGWIVSLHTAGDVLMADIELNAKGRQAVETGRFKYATAELNPDWVDEQGVRHGPAIVDAVLTNRPPTSIGPIQLNDKEDADMGRYDDREALHDRVLTLAAAEQVGYVEALDAVLTLDAEGAEGAGDPAVPGAPAPDNSRAFGAAVVPVQPRPEPDHTPPGGVDDHSRVMLPAGVDRDELMADPLAAKKAWRRLHESGARHSHNEESFKRDLPDEPVERFDAALGLARSLLRGARPRRRGR